MLACKTNTICFQTGNSKIAVQYARTGSHHSLKKPLGQPRCPKDGSLRFCIDYHTLNSVSKTETFLLPRIDDLLDQLMNVKYFSTLDLAAGYWQVQMHPDSCRIYYSSRTVQIHGHAIWP